MIGNEYSKYILMKGHIMDFNAIINQILVLFIVLFLGFFIRKINIIDEHASKKIASLVVKVTAPCLIINSMMKKTELGNREILQMLGLSIAVYICMFIMTFIIPKLLRIEKNNIGVYRFMIMFSNVGFMGFPVIESIFGKEAVFYGAIYNLPFYALVYTLGIYLISMDNKKNIKFKIKDIFNPGVCAVIIGLIIFSFKLNLPYVATKTIDMISSLTTPLSMIVIGASLAGIKIKNIFSNTKLYIYSFLKLLVFPIIILIIIRQLGFNEIMTGVPVIITGMPVAANAVILSKEYDGNDILASEGVFISTMLSIITIPVLVFLLSN
ncbi:AEC family transporter [Vallitalea guaymasensis]|uniref:AEC family transporter n=1 Tax=Vallitalea guaymasensis TaxID=1185412 RepID=A0A8J8SAD0_9FIRM|nr:AEC family transporter [Vallitalea guaymasensis]QUH27459.1 AEC family transporter [Vallitalea guaymasensis]